MRLILFLLCLYLLFDAYAAMISGCVCQRQHIITLMKISQEIVSTPSCIQIIYYTGTYEGGEDHCCLEPPSTKFLPTPQI